MELSKGPNAPIPVGEMLVAVQAPVAADIAAVLVTAAGKVRSDSDFVFYNQPVAPGVEVRPPDAIRVVTGAVPAEIEKVVVTVSLDGSGPANWGLVGPFRIVVNAAGTGESLAVFVPTGSGRRPR
ncbi:TerD family protein [Nocardia thailandica]|uniref:TerD family protein n=1 Tax=Nocardia thailandica TaxID=257275 RepID=UPI0002FC4F7C|nr:TerD family protein [Nocardia thailandica]